MPHTHTHTQLLFVLTLSFFLSFFFFSCFFSSFFFFLLLLFFSFFPHHLNSCFLFFSFFFVFFFLLQRTLTFLRGLRKKKQKQKWKTSQCPPDTQQAMHALTKTHTHNIYIYMWHIICFNIDMVHLKNRYGFNMLLLLLLFEWLQLDTHTERL